MRLRTLTLSGSIFLLIASPSALFSETPTPCSKAGENIKTAAIKDTAVQKQLELYREAIALCPKMVEAHYNLGLLQLRAGQKEDAVRSFEEALRLKDDKMVRVALANALTDLARYDEAKKIYEDLIAKDGESVALLQGLAVTHERGAEYAKALTLLNRAIELAGQGDAKGRALAYYNVGVIQERLGLPDKALEAYRKSSELDSEQFEARYYLAVLAIQQGEYVEAESALQSARELHPQDARVLHALAALSERKEDFDKAAVLLEQALAIAPDDSTALVDLAAILVRQKRYSRAEELLRKVLAHSPEDPFALSVLGWALLELGKLPEAKRSLEEAIERNPKDLQAHNNLSIVLERMGDKDEAARERAEAERLTSEAVRK